VPAPTPEIWLLGETKGFWIQTGAFLVSAIAAAITIFYNAKQVRLLREQNKDNEKSARSRATVDVVLHQKSDTELQASRQKFAELHATKQSFTKYACGELTDFKEENRAILDVLDGYEFIAAGIRTGAFDELMYKRMKCSLVIRDWKTLEPYVLELRRTTGRSRLYAELQWLAVKWEKEPLTDGHS
jgi:hypothetical protein